ncbi:hypothetical protein I4U23_015117 [Adineta vaga]|nr:hypothetical protein I4U23_015117 [Adineta vaga]
MIVGNVKVVIVGERTLDEPPRLTDIHEYDVSYIIPDKNKKNILTFLYQVLCFLQQNVKQDGNYLLSRHDQDEQQLTFITQEILIELGFNR